jgi:hypothetical protein
MKLIRTISALLLAMLVLVSSTSFMVGIHICMGEVQDIALFSKSEGCAMEKHLPPCHRHLSKPCCEDDAVVHDGDELKSSFEQFSFNPPLPVTLHATVHFIADIVPQANFDKIRDFYDPPLPTCDRIAKLQVFLI